MARSKLSSRVTLRRVWDIGACWLELILTFSFASTQLLLWFRTISINSMANGLQLKILIGSSLESTGGKN